MENAIVIEHLHKQYNMYSRPKDRFFEALSPRKKSRHQIFKALNDVSFDVKAGETVGIIGTNGAGKSTLLKIITGVLTPTSGNIEIQGKVSALLELGAGFNLENTGRENIYLNGRIMGYTRKEMDERVDSIIEFADIGEFIDQQVKTYSSGMFARLAFAVAINVEPDILIVDEALSVGDIFFQNKCFKKFDELKSKGVTILFVSHDIGSIRQMCSRTLWLEKGTVRAFGEANEICDMYMDEQRKSSEFVSGHLTDEQGGNADIKVIDEEQRFPAVTFVEDRFHNEKVAIRSVFFTDSDGEYVGTMYVDKEYSVHIVVECMEDAQSLIVGYVMENNKGLPLYDINNYISQREVVNGRKGQVLEVVYSFKLPRIMNGVYLVGCAVAQGTQARHEMLTWLHGVCQVEVINMGFNSSYIEIPSGMKITANSRENVTFL